MSATTDQRKAGVAGLWVAVVLGCVTACSSSAPQAGPSSSSSLGSQGLSNRSEGSQSSSTSAAHVTVAGQSATIDEEVKCRTSQGQFVIDALAPNNPASGKWDQYSVAITLNLPDMAVQAAQAYIAGKFQLIAPTDSAGPRVVPTLSRSGNTYTVTGRGDDALSGADDVSFEIRVTCP
jgi:hypothetical protein